MPPMCILCPTRWTKPREPANINTSYHRFPQEATRRKIWRDVCGIPENVDVSLMRICGAHFSADDYVTGRRAKLKKEAVPLFKPTPPSAAPVLFNQDQSTADPITEISRKKSVCFLCKQTSGPHLNTNITFHGLPTRAAPRELWKKICGIPKEKCVYNIKICSDHFALKDFRGPTASKRWLKKGVVPSKLLPHNIRPQHLPHYDAAPVLQDTLPLQPGSLMITTTDVSREETMISHKTQTLGLLQRIEPPSTGPVIIIINQNVFTPTTSHQYEILLQAQTSPATVGENSTERKLEPMQPTPTTTSTCAMDDIGEKSEENSVFHVRNAESMWGLLEEPSREPS